MRPFPLRRQWSAPATHRHFAAIFTPEECGAIIERYGAIEKRRSIQGAAERPTRDTDVRWIISEDTTADWIFERLGETIQSWNRLGFEFDITAVEAIQLAHYGVNQLYDWHVDFGPATSGAWRKLSIVVMMTAATDYRGGMLQFVGPEQPFSYDFAIGDAVVFPSWMKHRVTPVTEGRRWTMTTWFRGPAFR